MSERAASLPLIGGWLCLDFTNTTSGRGGDRQREHLDSYGDLLAWSEHAGALSHSDATALAPLALGDRAAANAVLIRALALRDALHALFVARLRGMTAPPDALALLNAALADALSRGRLRPAPDGFAWDWSGAAADLARPLQPIARAAADLLTSPALARLKLCPGRACGWLFVDGTKNGRRRWCEMAVCGSRAKARRYHRRRRREQPGPQ